MFTQCEAVLEEKRILNEKDAFLVLKVKEKKEVKPCQFCMLTATFKKSFDPFLKRPFGILFQKDDKIGLFIRNFGRGSSIIVKDIKESFKFDITYPLGNPFYPKKDKILLVAGGIGIAGIFWAGVVYKNLGKKVKLLFGGRTEKDLEIRYFLEKYNLDTTYYTEDGSFGKKGLVSQDLENYLDYTWLVCGPKAMMKAIFELGKKLNKKDIFFSLDTYMACGIGVCLGCTIETKNGYKRCCKEGPVFSIEELMESSF